MTYCPLCRAGRPHRWCQTVREEVVDEFRDQARLLDRVNRVLFDRLGWTTALPDEEFWAHFRAVRRARQASALVPEVLARLQVRD